MLSCSPCPGDISKQEAALRIAKAKYSGGGTNERDVYHATNILE
jgi:hypothetical protein